VRLWEVRDGACLHTLRGHTDMVWGVALSGDGQLAASGGADGTVRLWDVHDGACLHTLRAERSYDRLDITGLTGVTAGQRAALLALGALDQTPADVSSPQIPPWANRSVSY
jgi:WD40 repeat protein